MPDKKLIREKMRIDAMDTIIRNKRETLIKLIKVQEQMESLNNNRLNYLLSVRIKVQEQMESLTSKLNVLDKYDDLLSKRTMTEKEVEKTIYDIITNNTDKNMIYAILCLGVDIPEYLMDKMINELIAAKKWDLIKSVTICRDDLPTKYIDKLESYLVANELSKKSNSRYDDLPF
mgnify:CR=1 FL=1